MSGFRATKGGGATAVFTAQESDILTTLLRQLAELVENRGQAGTDSALERLLPDAYRDNPEDAAEFRRFTEDDLASRKVRNARAALDTLAVDARRRKITVTLDAAGVQSWLRTLTDLRLTLAARLDISADGELPASADPMGHAVYEWLGYLQETLVVAIDH
ncbi:MAG: hypothetical protein JWQ43_946 [Glaciihabitans sp.]|nr:hypothetical protein [Glaciihabitans sp.]